MELEGATCAKAPILRTPQDRENHRKSLYKSGSPAWKGAYRKRCLERLKASREKFLARFRNSSGADGGERERGGKALEEEIVSSVQEVMMEEWEHLKVEHSDLPSLPAGGSSPQQQLQKHTTKRRASFPECTSPTLAKRANRGPLLSSDDDFLSTDVDEDIEYVLSIMDELTQELIKEEQAILAQYEQELMFDEEALCSAIQSLSTNDVICPICQKNILHQNRHIIFCACGMRLDTAQDGITLDYLRQQLEDCSTQHSAMCAGTPVFSLDTAVGIQSMVMNCTVCDFMYIIA